LREELANLVRLQQVDDSLLELEMELGDLPEQVEHLRRQVAPQQKRRRGRRVDDPVARVDRDREQRPRLPFEHVLLVLMAVFPHLRRAAPLDDEVLLLIEVLHRVERAGARNLEHVAAPQVLRPPQLDEGRIAAHQLPRLQRQILHLAHPDPPENRDLLLAGAQAYASYASVLEEDEGDRAAYLSERAKEYALKALELTPPFKGALGKPLEVFRERLEQTEKKHVPTLFWVGNIWGGWIAAGSEGPAAMADLPWVEALMDRALQLDPGFYYGGSHLFKAILLSARPEQFGGNLKKAEEHFKKARDYGRGKFLLTDVYYAEYYARQTLNRDLFVSTLKKVLETSPAIEPDLTLSNTLAQRKAKKLLARVDEFF